MMEIISQIVISVCGVISCYLTATKRPNWACIWGLCAEPAWISTAVHHKQWGIFILALVYAYMWSYGIYNYWIKK